MKVLFLGGTGRISYAISKQLAEAGHELFLLNRGNRATDLTGNITFINADVHNEEDVSKKIASLTFDVVCDFIGFLPEHVERDYRLFKNNTKQFIYISSASAYQKPCQNYVITEKTLLSNPYWEYSRNKIACENYLMKMYHENNFPVTIIRPSHTYDERSIPVGLHGAHGSWQIIKRMLDRKPVIVHGDGTSLWTMTHNTDFAKGFIGLMDNPRAIGECFHITSNETLTWNQIYQTIADSLHVPFTPYYVASTFLADVCPPHYDLRGSLLGDKANSVVFDNTKLKQIVPDFEPTVSFSSGIKKALDYIFLHENLQQPDIEFDNWCDNIIHCLEHAKKN